MSTRCSSPKRCWDLRSSEWRQTLVFFLLKNLGFFHTEKICVSFYFWFSEFLEIFSLLKFWYRRRWKSRFWNVARIIKRTSKLFLEIEGCWRCSNVSNRSLESDCQSTSWEWWCWSFLCGKPICSSKYFRIAKNNWKSMNSNSMNPFPLIPLKRNLTNLFEINVIEKSVLIFRRKKREKHRYKIKDWLHSRAYKPNQREINKLATFTNPNFCPFSNFAT